ncbi:MAG: hypothetical protein M4579_007585 [Chaenotheca gracillima]|nr:MAG: hypothetical protein M4579_007585 [Chaenotheca gracillima]
MCVGVIDNTASNGRLVAFSGRKPMGNYVLQLLPKRFGAQTSSAGLYNKIGGQAHEVDYLFRRPLSEAEQMDGLTYALKLSVPSLTAGSWAKLFFSSTEVNVVVTCLDNLPWSQLAWSIHRGMKDVLQAYGKATLAIYRTALAETLRTAVQNNEFALAKEGWEVNFIQDSMADQAASAILGGDTCSGDGCRIVSAAALLLCENKDEASLDHTEFWSNHMQLSREGKAVRPISPLSTDTVIALVKLLFVVWSHEFDYEIYHCLPSELIVL